LFPGKSSKRGEKPMRMKFEKGMTPERVAENFVRYIRGNNLVIGAVNMYVQIYDDEMKPVKFDRDEVVIVRPAEETKQIYSEDVAHIRRRKMRVV